MRRRHTTHYILFTSPQSPTSWNRLTHRTVQLSTLTAMEESSDSGEQEQFLWPLQVSSPTTGLESQSDKKRPAFLALEAPEVEAARSVLRWLGYYYSDNFSAGAAGTSGIKNFEQPDEDFALSEALDLFLARNARQLKQMKPQIKAWTTGFLDASSGGPGGGPPKTRTTSETTSETSTSTSSPASVSVSDDHFPLFSSLPTEAKAAIVIRAVQTHWAHWVPAYNIRTLDELERQKVLAEGTAVRVREESRLRSIALRGGTTLNNIVSDSICSTGKAAERLAQQLRVLLLRENVSPGRTLQTNLHLLLNEVLAGRDPQRRKAVPGSADPQRRKAVVAAPPPTTVGPGVGGAEAVLGKVAGGTAAGRGAASASVVSPPVVSPPASSDEMNLLEQSVDHVKKGRGTPTKKFSVVSPAAADEEMKLLHPEKAMTNSGRVSGGSNAAGAASVGAGIFGCSKSATATEKIPTIATPSIFDPGLPDGRNTKIPNSVGANGKKKKKKSSPEYLPPPTTPTTSSSRGRSEEADIFSFPTSNPASGGFLRRASSTAARRSATTQPAPATTQPPRSNQYLTTATGKRVSVPAARSGGGSTTRVAKKKKAARYAGPSDHKLDGDEVLELPHSRLDEMYGM